jgi:hypothetical protein
MNKNLPYDLPDGEAVGPELPSATRDFSSGGPWDNGTFTRSNTIGVWSTDAGGIGPRTDGASLLGSDFWLISWSDLVDSDIYLNLDGALSLVSTASSGTQVVGMGSATTTAQLYLRASSAGTKTLSAFSLRSIPNSALIFENGSIDGSDRLLVTEKQDVSGFIGPDLVTNGDFDATGAWVNNQNNWTIAGDGKATYNRSGSGSDVIYQALGRSAFYEIEIDILFRSVGSSGGISFYDGVAYGDLITTSGKHTLTVENTDDGYSFFTIRGQNSDFDLLDVKLKAVYDYATGAAPTTGFPFTLPMTLT